MSQSDGDVPLGALNHHALMSRLIDLAKPRSFAEHFSMHTERGAALNAAAALDESLADGLRAQMINSSLKVMMFKEGGPLGNFGTRIQLSYLIGLVSKGIFQEMETIKDIRNKFAHRREVESFEHLEIKKLCAQLKLVDSALYIEEDNRKIFNAIFRNWDLTQLSYKFIATCIMLSVIVGMEAKSLSPVRAPLY